jgi:hypothetical protein
MTASKMNPPKYDPQGSITAFQIKRIMHNCSFNVEMKNEWVQWVTGDVKRTSLKSITQDQAVRIIRQQTGEVKPEVNDNWGFFDPNNSQHKRIQSNLRAANIVVKNEKHGEVADMEGWFNRFLKSNKSPVKKPLKTMSPEEVSKIIKALDGVVIWKNSI